MMLHITKRDIDFERYCLQLGILKWFLSSIWFIMFILLSSQYRFGKFETIDLNMHLSISLSMISPIFWLVYHLNIWLDPTLN